MVNYTWHLAVLENTKTKREKENIDGDTQRSAADVGLM